MASSPTAYPHTHCGDVTETLHGEQVADPYRWLEDPAAPATRDWVDQQNALFDRYIQQCPQRGRFRARLEQLWNHERFGLPLRRGGHIFFTHNPGLANQSILRVSDALDQPGRVLLDANKLSEDGTVALHAWSPNRDGTLVAWAQSSGGSDWLEWRVRQVATGQDLPDRVQWCKWTGASWLADGSGFFYGKYPPPQDGKALEEANRFHHLCFHRIGTDQSQDAVVMRSDEHPDWMFDGYVTPDGAWLIVTITRGTDPTCAVWCKDLANDGPLREVVGGFAAEYSFVTHHDGRFIFKTDADAPLGRVVTVNPNRPADPPVELIAEQPDALVAVTRVGNALLCNHLRDAHSAVLVRDLDGKQVRQMSLPGIGTVGGLGGRPQDTDTFMSFTSFTVPTALYRYEVATDRLEMWRAPSVAVDASQFETTQHFVTSSDGTQVPLFLVHRKDLKPGDGGHPTFLYGYGGFSISMTPMFSVSVVTWLEAGGVLAVACTRGGGEYGETWHKAGTRERKQNVFDDFYACAEHLIAAGWTSPPRLGIGGGSNGGLLVGASVTQRPELFGAAVCMVGVLDMLRFHRFTIGWAWKDDYGDPDVAPDYSFLKAYSPLHNVKRGTHYPATLLVTADHDDRVVPAHSYKFAAAMQAAQGGPAPILLRVDTRAGHGAGKSTAKAIEEEADKWAFLARVTGMEQA